MTTSKLLNGRYEDKIQEVKDSSIDMVLTDPPYNITQCSWEEDIDFNIFWEESLRVLKPKGCIIVFCNQPFSSKLISSNYRDYKYSYIWLKNKKTNFLNSKRQPLRRYEELAVFYRQQPKYIPQKTTGHKPVNKYTKNTSDGETMGRTRIGITGGGSTDRYPDNTLEFPVVNNDGSNGGRLHPTQKPVELLEFLISTYTDVGDTILDMFMGSGSTCVAAKGIGREYIGIEQDEKYFKIAEERIQHG